MSSHKQRINICWEASLFESDYNSGAPIARLHNHSFSEMNTHSGTWLKVYSKSSGKTIYRIGRGCAGNIAGLGKNVIMIDYYGATQLGVMNLVGKDGNREQSPTEIVSKIDGKDVERRAAYKADWEVTKANFVECIIANCKHPDRGYRVSIQIAFIGLAIGILSFFVSLISLLS